MRKFLSALNLLCVMLISGCNKNSNDFKSYDLDFTSVKNSGLVIIPSVDTGAVLLDFTKSDILLPDFPLPQKQFYLYSSEFTNLYNKNGVYKKINGYRIYNFTYDVDSYWLEEIVNVKISFEKVSSVYRIVSFSAEMPNKN
ncbi:hypothetical protein [Spiroplasma endosymbiont of Dromius quadrimaculatus]|uniref:hypothetical protein n=1 Tax=Spiroplasma endosymbiont of Dromius quadrimaculatus TaxID=3066283 RepID=UPI00313B943D